MSEAATTPAGAATPANPSQPPSAAEMFDLVADGKTEKVSRDELLRHASLGKTANSRFEEAAKMRKEADAKLSNFKDPKKAISWLTRDSGLDPKQIQAAFEEWYNDTVIKPETMTPEQKRWAQIERENAEMKESLAGRDRKQKEDSDRKMDEVTSQQLQKEITDILETSGLPKTKFTASRLAYWIRVNETRGINAPRDLIIQQIQKETADVVKSLASSAKDGAGLIKILGEDVVKMLRKHDLEQIRARRGGAPVTGTTQADNAPPPQKNERVSMAELKRRMREFR